MIPNDLLGGITLRVDKTSNRLWLTGSPEEVRSVISFLQIIDVPPSDGVILQTFYVDYIGAKEALALLPQGLLPQQATVFPNNSGFALFASQETGHRISEFIQTIDNPSDSIPVSLQYIRAEDLIKNLPPSIPKEKVVPSGSDDLIFFTGTSQQLEFFKRDLAVIDRPFAQIKYRILVIQYQRSGGEKAEVSFKAGPSENATAPFDFGVAGEFGKLLGLRFDVISGFGYDFALGLDFQLRSDQARVVADTMVTGLAGQELKFQNTNTYRYFIPSTDPDTGEEKETGITREITSGLIIGLKGWVSGNGMITMDINATVSKRGTSAEDNLSTSERVVSTQARTQAGIPLVVGGLLQWDTVTKDTKVPILGDIPLLGALFRSREKVDELTELVIYILPTVVTTKQVATVEDQFGYWYEKFLNRLSTSLQNREAETDEE
jgi:type II secretory pathway component GspD/PulD (secretin)